MWLSFFVGHQAGGNSCWTQPGMFLPHGLPIDNAFTSLAVAACLVHSYDSHSLGEGSRSVYKVIVLRQARLRL